ncbi:hypothetical protein EC973_008477 [Apophysomyces ossiformis]|uniref:BRCT domain-containing protein n=1 Tax=Apophysomyces ossiformis TaxID=679940 RepID=A0A8H7BTN0_9FUNG|nr:hypothetical protein EC973_008477 [Apophysomyces ossiformis]
MSSKEQEAIQNCKTSLFRDVFYVFDRALSRFKREHIEKLLSANGASAVENQNDDNADTPSATRNPTHIISTRPLQPNELAQFDHGIALVTPQWVEAAVRNGFTHDAKYYSPDPRKIFSGTVVSTSGLPKSDRESIYGGLLALGGQYREDLTAEVTHLVCLKPEGEKYDKAINENNIKVVLPQWVDDCLKFRRLVREDIFQFPDPPFLRTNEENAINDARPRSADDPQSTEKDESTIDNLGQMIYQYPKTMLLLPEVNKGDSFLNNRTFYLSSDLEISKEFQTSLEKLLVKAGATVSEEYNENTDIVITKWRSSSIYLKACKDQKVVASLWWASNTLWRRRFELPTRTLLDYPRPKGGIPGMENAVITITSYSGIARDYLRRLITAVGATYTANMTESQTTHVICSSKNSTKYRVARHWNLAVVNHLWIEECFQLWTCKSVEDERYVYFPGGKILDQLVGQTPLISDELEKWWKVADQVPKVFCPDSLRVPSKKTGLTLPLTAKEKTSKSDASSSSPTTPRSPKDPVSPSAQGTGSVTRKRPRQAAVAATHALQTVIVPDLNAYQKEMKTKRIKVDEDNLDEDNYTNRSSSSKSEASINHAVKHGNDLTSRVVKRSIGEQQSGPSMTSKAKPTVIKIATSGTTLASDQKAAGLTDIDVQALRRLGAQLTESIVHATHLIVEERILRTPKFLCAVNLGLDIVQVDWIKDTIRNDGWQDVAPYAVVDRETEDRHNFSLSGSLALARQSRVEQAKMRHGTWLQGWDVCVLQSSKNVLKEVIETAGGKFVNKTYARKLCDLGINDSEKKLLIISDPKDKTEWAEFTSHGISIYDIEMVIVGSFRQRLDLDQFKLH